MTGRRRLTLQVGLAFLAVAEAVAGIWALLLPRTFYDDFPLPGHDWVAMLPPYNQHLITDVGELNLALAFILTTAMLTRHRLLVRTALAGYLFYTVPHLVFHTRHLGGMPPSDATAETIVLSITVALPLALLSLTIKPQPESESAAHPSTDSTRAAVHRDGPPVQGARNGSSGGPACDGA